MYHDFAPLKPCPLCGGKALINEPSYADENVSVFCESCDASTMGYMMNLYCEGTHQAIEDWNNGKVYSYER